MILLWSRISKSLYKAWNTRGYQAPITYSLQDWWTLMWWLCVKISYGNVACIIVKNILRLSLIKEKETEELCTTGNKNIEHNNPMFYSWVTSMWSIVLVKRHSNSKKSNGPIKVRKDFLWPPTRYPNEAI